MKTSTVIILAVAALVYVSTMQRGSTGSVGAAPVLPPQQPQSGGGDTFNSVMNLIASGLNTAGKALDLAEDRAGPKS